MSWFEPGEGWREVDSDEAPFEDYLYLNEDRRDRYWVREAPVPPLPTELNTVIEATWRNGEVLRIWLLAGSGAGALWIDSHGHPIATAGITGFEVLAEPRAVTAKAVFDRLATTWTHDIGYRFDEVAREFGVDA